MLDIFAHTAEQTCDKIHISNFQIPPTLFFHLMCNYKNHKFSRTNVIHVLEEAVPSEIPAMARSLQTNLILSWVVIVIVLCMVKSSDTIIVLAVSMYIKRFSTKFYSNCKFLERSKIYLSSTGYQ